MPGSALSDIQTKVRKLTYSPDQSSLSDAELNQYINTFYVFDFPRELRTLDRRVNLNILLNANQQSYPLEDIPTTLAYPNITNLKDFITSIYGPIYVNGQQVQYTQSQNEFYNYFPKYNARDTVGVGLGAPFVLASWTMQSTPVVAGSVSLSAVQTNGLAVRVQDVPNDPYDAMGTFVDQDNVPVAGTVNYVTGQILNVNLGTPANGAQLYVYYLPYSPGQPSLMLWFDSELSFWPIPDQGYQCTFEADVTFADLVNQADQPIIRECWQYIAYGAAIKVLQDRMDLETVNLIYPEFERQELLVNRKFITQQSTNRVATIYSNLDGLGPFINNNSSTQ